MQVLIELGCVAGSFSAGRVWQWRHDRKALEVNRHIADAFNAISDIATHRRQAEQQIRNHQNKRGDV